MTSDLEVDAEAVRVCAAGLADTAAQVTADRTPPPAVSAPRWQTKTAAEALAEESARILTQVAGDLEAFRRAVLAAVDDYGAADSRAAARLGGTR